MRTQDALALVRRQQEATAERRAVIPIMTDAPYDDDASDDEEVQRMLARKEAEEQVRIHDETQRSLETVVSQLRTARTRQVIGDVNTDQESRALVGLPERLVGKMDQRIGDVSTSNKSSSLVGVFDQGVDMKDFFKRD